MIAIDSLAKDTIYEIFLLIHQCHVPRNLLPGPLDTQFPWNVASVCQSWRALALSVPQLWTSIRIGWHIPCDDVNVSHITSFGRLAIMRCLLQLKRSKALPLSIESAGSQTPMCPCNLAILRIAARHQVRWVTFELNYSSCGPAKIRTLMPHRIDLSRLKKLVYNCSDGGGDDPADYTDRLHHLVDYSSLASLESLSLINWPGSYADDDNSHPAYPWSQLTDVCISDFRGEPEELLELLSQSYQMVSFKLEFYGSNSPSPIMPDAEFLPDSIILPRLTRMTWNTAPECANSLLDILNYIRTPQLRYLSYRYIGDVAEDYDHTALPGLISRSSCKLEYLELPLTDETEYSSVLNRTRALQELVLFSDEVFSDVDEEGTCDSLLRGFIKEEDSPFFAPQLQKLQLLRMNFDPILVGQIIESRNCSSDEDTVPLSIVHIDCSRMPVNHLKKAEGCASVLRDYIDSCDLKHPCNLVFKLKM
jgi:hypothetical protein